MNISLIEFAVYGFVTYASFLMLIITTIRAPIEKTKKMALVRAAYMMPGIITAIILAGSGVNIDLDNNVTSTNATSIYEVLDNTNVIVVLNSTVTEVQSESNYFTLQNPVWVSFHYMLALVMAIFIFIQIFTMLTAKE